MTSSWLHPLKGWSFRRTRGGSIGYLTPPVGLNLIVAIAAFKVAFGTIVRSVIPFITIMLIWLVIVIVYPTLSLGLLGR